MGFTTGTESIQSKAPTREQVVESIDLGLRQRFHDKITLLPPMLPTVYARADKQIAMEIRPTLLPARKILSARKNENGALLLRAADGSLGMRTMEELRLKALLLAGKG